MVTLKRFLGAVSQEADYAQMTRAFSSTSENDSEFALDLEFPPHWRALLDFCYLEHDMP